MPRGCVHRLVAAIQCALIQTRSHQGPCFGDCVQLGDGTCGTPDSDAYQDDTYAVCWLCLYMHTIPQCMPYDHGHFVQPGGGQYRKGNAGDEVVKAACSCTSTAVSSLVQVLCSVSPQLSMYCIIVGPSQCILKRLYLCFLCHSAIVVPWNCIMACQMHSCANHIVPRALNTP